MSDTQEPFFILGCGRSGTSLLSRMLNQHSSIAVPLESHIYNTFHPLLKYYGDLSQERNRSKLVSDILSTDVMKDWKPCLTTEDVMNGQNIDSFGNIFSALMKSWARKNNKPRWGEKTPHHIDYWDEISETWPDAKIIHIYRDGRDVALSFLNARFGPKTICSAARHWVNYLTKVTDLKNTASASMLEVSYEDLLDNPETVLREVCDFLEEPYQECMLDFFNDEVQCNTDEQNRRNLTGPLLRENKNKWRRLMNESDVRIFEAVASEMLEEYSYQIKNKNPVIRPLERLYHDLLLFPTKKIRAMVKNTKGHKDALIKLKLYLSLRVHWYFRYGYIDWLGNAKGVAEIASGRQ